MHRIRLVFFGLTFVMMAGCSSLSNRVTAQSPSHSLNHFYDFQLIRSADQQPITMAELVQELSESDVIFVGEVHSHSASHYLQMQILSELYQQNEHLMLSMEQFERDKQDVLDDYLSDKIGEQTLMREGDAWGNYASDYRPLVEFAKAHHLPVIAANAPKALVRCIAQKGPEVVDRLPEQQRAYLADQWTHASDAYQKKFRQFMTGAGSAHGQPQSTPHSAHPRGHGEQDDKFSNIFYAQLARDNTMAESIARALDAHPHDQVMAINGAFHSDGWLGIVDALKRLKPTVKIKVLSPYEQSADKPELAEAVQQGDYLYVVQTMPKRFVQKGNRDRAVMAMVEKRSMRECAW